MFLSIGNYFYHSH